MMQQQQKYMTEGFCENLPTMQEYYIRMFIFIIYMHIYVMYFHIIYSSKNLNRTQFEIKDKKGKKSCVILAIEVFQQNLIA